jgi:hypothetical protein
MKIFFYYRFHATHGITRLTIIGLCVMDLFLFEDSGLIVFHLSMLVANKSWFLGIENYM